MVPRGRVETAAEGVAVAVAAVAVGVGVVVADVVVDCIIGTRNIERFGNDRTAWIGRG